MDKSLLQKYAQRADSEQGGFNVLDLEITDDHGAFGWHRGIKDRCAMLELRKRGGDIIAVSYGYIDRITFNPSKGIEVSVGGPKIVIKGRNLNTEIRPTVRLFDGLTRHRVPWIREASQADIMEAQEGECLVESIEW